MPLPISSGKKIELSNNAASRSIVNLRFGFSMFKHAYMKGSLLAF